ncbi:Mur ligase family protein [Noviherbaspirillum soli]|uniref:Mur ligase family protein n=1 Tax=Noviherbaspirillum soli TaxID=1064518 RepID=UPI00188CD504|nr:Mur ligase family protein [Noviherbaspirillum soli]
MNLTELRFLRGPNRYARQPCLMAVIDHDDGAPAAPLPPAAASLLAMLAGHALARHATAVHLAGALAQSLQRAAGCTTGFWTVRREHGLPHRYRLALGYQIEALAESALEQSMQLTAMLLQGQAVDAEAALASLRLLAQQHAPGPGAAAIARAALARRIPLQPLSGPEPLCRLGWGNRQQRLHAADATELDRMAAEPARQAAGALLGTLFAPGSDGRIPVIAIAGTNGKTTTTRMIGHAFTLAGLRAGIATTEGIYIGGQQVDEGDCTGYWSARMVLEAARAEVAVLETARGGLLKRGLGFDRCDVAVMLNVSADHLGMDGVHSVAELAEVKSVVARAARRAAVLNAEDAHCVAMRARLGRGVEAIYFSMDHAAPVLLRHLARGGRGVYLKDGRMMLASHGQHRSLIEVTAMPAALGGHAMHNVANAMAATAALIGAGRAPELAVAALSSFVSDATGNPLRANLFEAGGIAILVDYAHNSAACASLVTMARSLCSGRLRAVITVPGDRRDCDLADIGRICGAGFDELLVYEAEPRGRPRGETASRLLAGARQAGAGWSDAEPDVRQALARMLARCQAGDMLVFTCGGSLDDLVAVLRPLYPEAAQTVAGQVK